MSVKKKLKSERDNRCNSLKPEAVSILHTFYFSFLALNRKSIITYFTIHGVAKLSSSVPFKIFQTCIPEVTPPHSPSPADSMAHGGVEGKNPSHSV